MAVYNLIFSQGESVTKTLTLKNGTAAIDLTGCSFISQIRSDYDSGSILATVTPTVINAVGGVLQLTLSGAVTSTLTVNTRSWKLPKNAMQAAINELPSTKYLWDLFMTKGTTVTKVLEGGVLVLPRVSR